MDEIKRLAIKLQRDAKRLVKENTQGTHRDYSSWGLRYENMYERGVKYRSYTEGRDLFSDISNLESFRNLKYAIEEVGVGHVDKRVRTLFQEGDVNATSLIQLSLVNVEDLLSVRPYNAKKLRAKFFSELTRETYNVRLVTPIVGLSVARTVMLGQGYKLIAENKKDTIKCLNWGLLDDGFPQSQTFWIHDGHPGISFLVSEIAYPLAVDRIISNAEREEFNSFQNAHEFRLESLQMVFDLYSHKINLGKTIVTHDYLIMPSESIMNIEPTPRVFSWNTGLVVSNRLKKNLRVTYEIFNDESIRTNKMLRLACSRIAMARQRKNQEDAFLDLMIACEAFYMTNLPDHHIDLSYRLRYRAAYWYHGSEYTRKEIMQLFNSAYSVRSKIAHGEVPSAQRFRGRQFEMRELHDAIESILKAGLLDFIAKLESEGNNYEVDWDRLLLGD